MSATVTDVTITVCLSVTLVYKKPLDEIACHFTGVCLHSCGLK